MSYHCNTREGRPFDDMTTTTITSTFEAIELEPLSNAKTRHSAPEQRSSLQIDSPVRQTIDVSPTSPPARSTLQIFFTIFMPSFVGFLASFSSGIITVGLPDIARSLSLDRSLYLWPSSVYGLTAGSTLLIAGSIADIVGARPVELLGIFLMGAFALACGFASNGEQLVVFRALQGVALAMHLPSSVALIAGAVPSGRARNFGFACLGFSQPLGFAFGLVIGGVLIDRAGWRSGFYMCGGATLLAAIVAVWSIPQVRTGNQHGFVDLCKQVGRQVDWIGGLISSGGLATLAYVLA
jgi:MFS family permease